VFAAVMSATTLKDAMNQVTTAISEIGDIRETLQDVAGDLPVPHPAFMICPDDERRTLFGCRVQSISKWVLDTIFSTLDSRGAEAAYNVYRSLEGSLLASSFRRQLWERKVQQYFRSGNISSFTVRCLEDGDSSTLTTLASFDAIIYEPNKPFIGSTPTHLTNTCRSLLLQQHLLRPSDTPLKLLRPPVTKPWTILFIVPAPMQTTFRKQKFGSDAAFWKAQTKQYVLGLDSYAVFHCNCESASQ
jgi:hypothetical protein